MPGGQVSDSADQFSLRSRILDFLLQNEQKIKLVLFKEGKRVFLQNRFGFCAPPKVPRPICGLTWLDLEDKKFFLCKIKSILAAQICQFVHLYVKNGEIWAAKIHVILHKKNILSSSPSHVSRHMGRGTISGAQASIFPETTALKRSGMMFCARK